MEMIQSITMKELRWRWRSDLWWQSCISSAFSRSNDQGAFTMNTQFDEAKSLTRGTVIWYGRGLPYQWLLFLQRLVSEAYLT
jgi:hypothetical protein